MTTDELHDAILADAAAKSLADAGNDAGCAARMTEILPPTVVRRMADWSTIATAFATPSDGVAVVEAIKAAGSANAVVAFFLPWLDSTSPSGLDLGNAAVRGMLDVLAAGGAVSAQAAAAIKGLAEEPTVITPGQVSDAWLQYRPGGIVGAPSS
jgi:hypothetical protein